MRSRLALVAPTSPRRVVGATTILVELAVSCASGDDSSFTSLAAADEQARTWVDSAVTSAIPGASTAAGHSEGPDSCTTSPDFAEMSYSLSVDVPREEVDAAVAAVWQGFQENGFVTNPTGGPAPARAGLAVVHHQPVPRRVPGRDHRCPHRAHLRRHVHHHALPEDRLIEGRAAPDRCPTRAAPSRFASGCVGTL